MRPEPPARCGETLICATSFARAHLAKLLPFNSQHCGFEHADMLQVSSIPSSAWLSFPS
jgi:hypothetical protein